MNKLIISTIDDRSRAEEISSTLVRERLAACVNIVPGVTSYYRWKGEVEKDSEIVLLIKTTEEASQKLMSRLKELHPYNTPEAILLDITGGLPDYLKWLEDSVMKRK